MLYQLIQHQIEKVNPSAFLAGEKVNAQQSPVIKKSFPFIGRGDDRIPRAALSVRILGKIPSERVVLKVEFYQRIAGPWTMLVVRESELPALPEVFRFVALQELVVGSF